MNLLERFTNRLLGRTTIKATEYVQFSKPIDSKTEKKLNKLILDNAGNTVEVGDHVCYLVDKKDIRGAEHDPHRPDFKNAVVIEIIWQRFRPTMVCIEQDKKFITVLPQLLKKRSI